MITLERRPFKSIQHVVSQDAAQKNGGSVTRPNHEQYGTFRRPFKMLDFVAGTRRSDYITTRCYSASGQQIWDGDHGSDVFALAVDSHGTVYQTGAGNATFKSDGMGGFIPLEDSLFHEYPENPPTVTAMYPGGEPKWSRNKGIADLFDGGGRPSSSGIAVTTNGAVYVALTYAFGDTRNRVAKLSSASGAELLRLPVAGFQHSLAVAEFWSRVRVDGANNVYAAGFGLVPQPVKWVNDLEFWNSPSGGTSGYRYTGMGVSSNGRVFLASDPPSETPPGGALFLIYDSAVSNLGSLTGTFLARVAEDANIEWNTDGWGGVGTSPSGRCITQGPQLSDPAGDEYVQEIAVTADPTAPGITLKTPLPSYGGQLGAPEVAVSINDAGIYCYSKDRNPIPVTSHEIRAADNSLIGRYDHGGGINDCLVLPNGSVIVAGQRVARADFP